MPNLSLPEAACALIIRNDMEEQKSHEIFPSPRLLAVSRRISNPSAPRLWGLPGGKVDRSKDSLRNGRPMTANAAKRETREESGVSCLIMEPFFVALSGVTRGTHLVTTYYAKYDYESPVLKIEENIDHAWLTWHEFLTANAFPTYNRLMAEAWDLKYGGTKLVPLDMFEDE